MEAWIDLDFSNYSDDILEIIGLFGKIGWDIYNQNNEVEYLPVGNNGDYFWVWEYKSKDEIMDILSQKISNKEQIGIHLYNADSQQGVSFLAENTEKIILGLGIYRRTVFGRYTDMAWYYRNIIEKLHEIDVSPLSYNMMEYED